MVKGQINAFFIGACVIRQQPRGGDVHRHHPLRHKALRRGIGGKIGGGIVRQAGIWQQIRRFSQRPQRGAQGGGTAHRISVRPHMGQNQHMVEAPQQFRSFQYGQHAHASSSGSTASLSGFTGFTFSGSRKTSKICAP